MNYLNGKIKVDNSLRATLSVTLLGMGRFEEALEASIPLIGTSLDGWFLYIRSWHLWANDSPGQAKSLLECALRKIEGISPASEELEFQLNSDGCPNLHILPREDLQVSISDYLEVERPLPPPLDPTKPLKFEQLEELSWFIAPAIILTVAPLEIISSCLRPDPDVPSRAWDFVVYQLSSRPRLESVATELWRLHGYNETTEESAMCAAFFLVCAGRYNEALTICNSLEQKNDEIETLNAIALWRSGRKLAAQEELMRSVQSRPGSYLALCILSLLALEHKKLDVALRYGSEAMNRMPNVGGIPRVLMESLWALEH